MGTSVSSRASARREGRSALSGATGRVSIDVASPCDHLSIHGFLTNVFGGPSRHEYNCSLEYPFYEPHDRLVAKCGSQIVGHAQLTRWVMQFGSLALPVTSLAWLGVLPEVRGRGIGRRLLDAAEKQMVADGAIVGLLRTRVPHFFRPAGWALCGRYSRSEASPRPVLRELLDRGFQHLHRRRCRLNVRPWRRMELPALVRIYNQNIHGQFGPLERSEAYWRWLIRRKAYERLYVALDGPDLLELREDRSPIVGYAATLGDEIVEIQAAPDHRTAATHLLARVCRDAIESDRHRIVLHSPRKDPLHRLLRSAGGRQYYSQADRGEVFMARLLDPLALLCRMQPELHRRVKEGRVKEGRVKEHGLPLPVELGLLTGDRKYRLVANRHTVSVTTERIGRSYLKLNETDFTRLLLGHLDLPTALGDGRVKPSTALASTAGLALFPRLPSWHPPLDDLPG